MSLPETIENKPLTPATDASTALISMIERVAIDPNMDIDKLERMLDMQERIINKNAETAYNAAMASAQAEMPIVLKNAHNQQTASNYATLERINAQIVPVYSRHGFSLSFDTGESPKENCMRIYCDVLHKDGHKERKHYDMPLDDSGIKGTVNKTKVHASGSTISYARRYLTMMIFNIATTDDNDGNGKPEEFINSDQVEKINNALSQLDEETKARFLTWLGAETTEEIPKVKFNEAFIKLNKKINGESK